MPWTRSEPTPSQAPLKSRGRCREQTAGTYGRKAMVKACSRPRTAPRAGGESRSGKKIPRPRGRTGSIPVSGTTRSITVRRIAHPYVSFIDGSGHDKYPHADEVSARRAGKRSVKSGNAAIMPAPNRQADVPRHGPDQAGLSASLCRRYALRQSLAGGRGIRA